MWRREQDTTTRLLGGDALAKDEEAPIDLAWDRGVELADLEMRDNFSDCNFNCFNHAAESSVGYRYLEY
jgi:hypothetical protein